MRNVANWQNYLILTYYLQRVEVHGVCTRKDRRAESERSQPEAAGHLRLHLPPAAMWRPAAQTPDPAQVKHRVGNYSSAECWNGCSADKQSSNCSFCLQPGAENSDGSQPCFHLIHSKTLSKLARMWVSELVSVFWGFVYFVVVFFFTKSWKTVQHRHLSSFVLNV